MEISTATILALLSQTAKKNMPGWDVAEIKAAPLSAEEIKKGRAYESADIGPSTWFVALTRPLNPDDFDLLTPLELCTLRIRIIEDYGFRIDPTAFAPIDFDCASWPNIAARR
jgi:hypothetical protein